MTRRPDSRQRHRARVRLLQLAIVVGFLAAWEFIPRIPGVSDVVTFADPYFVSAPSEISAQLVNLATGDGTVSVWPYLGATMLASLLGTLIGTVLGAGVGMWLSNNASASEVLKPMLNALNAVPRIALIPVIVIIFGPSVAASTITAITVVFFVVFFNAYEGGRSVSPHVIQNVAILGASKSQLMYRVRSRFVLAWTLAALPNALAFSLISVVTAEILTGTVGMGRLILTSVTTVDASLTFAVVVILSLLGLLLVGLAELFERRWLHWWRQGEGAAGA